MLYAKLWWDPEIEINIEFFVNYILTKDLLFGRFQLCQFVFFDVAINLDKSLFNNFQIHVEFHLFY